MNQISILGVDLGKSSFQLHGNDEQGREVLTRKVSRQKLLTMLATLPPCVVAMEACGGSHYWAQEIEKLGHQVKQIPPQEVKPFVKRYKTDARDAAAIAECAARPSTRVVAQKSPEQVDIQSIHRVRDRLVRERTAIANELRGLLLERGIVGQQGRAGLQQLLTNLAEREEDISPLFRELILDLWQQWRDRDEAVDRYGHQLEQLGKEHEICKKLMQIPGIGSINATLLFSYAGNGHQYPNGRDFSASLGLVPKQHSTGGRDLLLGISKRGNKQLRKQLVHGARAAYRWFLNEKEPSRIGTWVKRLAQRKHPNQVIVALANKLARIAWKVMARNEAYRAM